MTVMHLIAVGDSSWSRFGRLEGQRDVSLSEKGRRQILEIAKQLKQIPLRNIYYARTTRGNQAAKIIHDELCADELFMQELRRKQRVKSGKVESGMQRGSYFSLTKRNQHASIKLHRDERLNDIHYGALQGLYIEEIEMRHAETWTQFQHDPIQAVFPQGESMVAVVERVKQFLSEQHTNELFDVHVGVITHVPIVQLLTCLAGGKNVHQFREVSCADGSLSVVQYG